jgi:hypothetical protein
MTETEHANLVRAEAAGTLLIGVDRPIARKFYTDVGVRDIQAKTGEAPYFEKLIVFACFLGSPTALLAAIGLSVVNFHWWSIAIIPGLLFLWVCYYVASPRGDSGAGFITSVLGVSIAAYIFNPFGWSWTPFLLCAVLAFWCGRFLYVASTFFLRAFVIRNHQAFNLFEDTIAIKRLS